MITFREVTGKKDLKKFVDFQFDLYKGDPFWVPPLKQDELRILDPGVNPAYKFCDGKFWIAEKNGRMVGRIGGLINHRYNEKAGLKIGRITRMEFEDDPAVSSGLFEKVEEWLKNNGMSAVHGPLGFTNIDNQGLLIEGFGYLPSIASVHNKPYYRKHFEDFGFGKENDWIEFQLKLGEEIPEKAIRLADVIRKRFNLEIVHFSNPSEMKAAGQDVFRLLNKAFGDLPYVTPFDPELTQFYLDKYFKVLNPEFAVVIRKDGEIRAFILGMPSLSRAMQKANGRLFPFGLFHIMRAIRKPKVMDLLLTGVDPEYQAMGLPAILIAELQKSMMKHKVRLVETTGIFESNQKAIQHWKNYDHIQHKRRRCFVKDL